MSETFTKLFSSITDSTIWSQDNETRLVWITMLAMSDQNGYVGASVDGLARRANVPIEATERALAAFLGPDPRSRSLEHEGRRIAVAERGWTLLNYRRFRELRDEDIRREGNRLNKQAQRQREKRLGHVSNVTRVSPGQPRSAQVDQDLDRDPDQIGSDTESLVVAATTPPVLVFPCNGEPDSWPLTQARLDRWSQLFPGVDCHTECLHALAWIEANGRKTAKGMPRFLAGWLGRCNDRIRGSQRAAGGKTSNNESVALALMREKGLL